MVGELVMKLWMFGSDSNNGANCGLAYANSNNAWSESNANISARHTFLINTLSGAEDVSSASYESVRFP